MRSWTHTYVHTHTQQPQLSWLWICAPLECQLRTRHTPLSRVSACRERRSTSDGAMRYVLLPDRISYSFWPNQPTASTRKSRDIMRATRSTSSWLSPLLGFSTPTKMERAAAAGPRQCTAERRCSAADVARCAILRSMRATDRLPPPPYWLPAHPCTTGVCRNTNGYPGDDAAHRHRLLAAQSN